MAPYDFDDDFVRDLMRETANETKRGVEQVVRSHGDRPYDEIRTALDRATSGLDDESLDEIAHAIHDGDDIEFKIDIR